MRRYEGVDQTGTDELKRKVAHKTNKNGFVRA